MTEPAATPRQPFAITPARFRTLYGRLAAVLFALCVVLGALYTAWMSHTSQLYLQEVNQKLNLNHRLQQARRARVWRSILARSRLM